MKILILTLTVLFTFNFASANSWPPKLAEISVEQLSRRATVATYMLSIKGTKSMTGENIDKVKAKCEELTQNKENSGEAIDLVRVYEGEIEAICVIHDM